MTAADKIAAVLAAHKLWLQGKDGGKRANLTGANLRGANLARASLRGASLVGANLAGAYFARANLAGADFSGADFARATLRGAFLARATLRGAFLAGATLVGANLTGASLVGANLTGADLARADLTGVNLDGAKIYGKTAISLFRRATRSDGYEFFLWRTKEGYYVKAGCSFLDMEAARQHWTTTRHGTPLGAESLDILDFFDGAIKREGGAA